MFWFICGVVQINFYFLKGSRVGGFAVNENPDVSDSCVGSGFFPFLFWHLFRIIIGLLLYKAYLFQMIPAVSNSGSLLLLAGSVLACSLIGIIWERKKHRNLLSILINLSLGFGLLAVTNNLNIYSMIYKIIIDIFS